MITDITDFKSILESNKLKYYHTSGTRFKVGDVIGGPGILTFLHTNPVPHGTIQEIVEAGYGSWKEYSEAHDRDIREWNKLRTEWEQNPVGDRPEFPKTVNPKPVQLFVYEMKPFEKPSFGNCNDEYVSNGFVEVIRVVGSAKGILNNFRKKFGNGSKAHYFGGVARKPNK